MTRLEYLRRTQKMRLRDLQEVSHVDQSYLSKAERRGLHLSDGQAKRVAEALGWDGDPQELFEEVN